jgi:hypothetical protein
LLAWVFFRADSLSHAFGYLERLATTSWASPQMLRGLPYVAALLAIEWVQRERLHSLSIESAPVVVRWGVYYSLIAVLFLCGNTGHQSFIYFQF